MPGHSSVATPSFSLANFFGNQCLDFNTIHEFTFVVSFINLTHCCILTKPNYIAVLIYTAKQHSKQYTGLKYVIYAEMTD